MNESIALAIITGIQAIILALIPVLIIYVRHKFSKVEQPLAEVKHNVVNDHTTNMREEADDRHHENSKMLASIRLAQVNTEALQLEQASVLDRLLDLGVENRRRIIALEKTENNYGNSTEAQEPESRRSRRERRAYSPPHPESRRDRSYRGGPRGDWSGAVGDHA